MARASNFLGNPPPDAPQDSEAYQSWLRNGSDAPQAQALGTFDHDAFIAAQFTEAEKISSKNPWVEAEKVKKVRKNARTAKNKALKRAAQIEAEGLAAAHAPLKKVEAEDMKVRKQKKGAKRNNTATAAQPLEREDVQGRKEDSVMAGDEDALLEWEDVDLSGRVAKVDNDDDDDLVKQLQAEFDRDAEKEAAAAKKAADRRKSEWLNGGFAGKAPRMSEYDRRMAKVYD